MGNTFNMDTFFRTCGLCGKEVSIHDYKRYKWKKLINGKVVYFCCYSHYNKGTDDTIKWTS